MIDTGLLRIAFTQGAFFLIAFARRERGMVRGGPAVRVGCVMPRNDNAAPMRDRVVLAA